MRRIGLPLAGLAPLVVGLTLVSGAPAGASGSPQDAGEPPAREPEAMEPRPAPAPSKPERQAPPPRRGTLPGDVQKVFVLRHLNSGYLTRLLRVFPAEISSVEVRAGSGVNAIAVSAKPAVVAAIEETIKRLDQPGTDERPPIPNVEITGYILAGLTEPTSAEALPSDLQGVMTQLRRTFAYASYRLLDTVVARGRGDGSQCEVSGVTTEQISPLAPSFYSLQASTAIDPASSLIRLSHFRFEIEVPVPVREGPSARSFQYKSIGLSSNIDVREGQFAVVGKSGLGDSRDALVLVLSARVVD